MTLYEITLLMAYLLTGLSIVACGIDWTPKSKRSAAEFKDLYLDFYAWTRTKNKNQIDLAINRLTTKYNEYVEKFGDSEEIKNLYYKALKSYNRIPDAI